MCGIYDYRARRVLFAVKLQDRGEHRARYASTYKTIENVVITLFYEQGTDENYYDFFLHYIIHLQRLDSSFRARCTQAASESSTCREAAAPRSSGLSGLLHLLSFIPREDDFNQGTPRIPTPRSERA